jgi:hypothetical protein
VTSQLISLDIGCFISIIVSISMVGSSYQFNNSWDDNYSDTRGKLDLKLAKVEIYSTSFHLLAMGKNQQRYLSVTYLYHFSRMIQMHLGNFHYNHNIISICSRLASTCDLMTFGALIFTTHIYIKNKIVSI